VLGLRPFDVQLIGGVILHEGQIAEMRTGEGKTLVSVLPAFLNALTGKGVHVVTVNDYLAKRDSEWVGQVHKFLGLEVGLVQQGLSVRSTAVSVFSRRAFLGKRVATVSLAHSLAPSASLDDRAGLRAISAIAARIWRSTLPVGWQRAKDSTSVGHATPYCLLLRRRLTGGRRTTATSLM